MDPKSGREISLAEAIAKNILNPALDTDKVAGQMAALRVCI